MQADITNYQSKSFKNFGKFNLATHNYSLIKIYDLSKKYRIDYPDEPNFAQGYLPEIQYKDLNSVQDIFMKTISKDFSIDGAKCIRFIPITSKGKIYEDITMWTQILPQSFVARISCSHRNFDPSSLSLDYFIDLDNIQLNNDTEFGGQIITFINKDLSEGYTYRDDRKIEIDELIADFNNHKDEVFYEYFKYDFGNAVKNTNLAN